MRKHQQNGEKSADNDTGIRPYELRMSTTFLLGSAISCIFFCITVGYQAGIMLSGNLNKPPTKSSTETPVMPQPILPISKNPPKTTYSQKQYNTVDSVSNSETLLARKAVEDDWIELDVAADTIEKANSEDDHEEYQPAGQHLIIDIENVNAAFLNSEQQLAKAMMDLINLSGLTLLSYHCHALKPMGVTCVGVLLESHISFHTWPIPGVITLDLFTCGNSPLLPLLPTIEDLFAIPMLPPRGEDSADPPHIIWTHKKRGFRYDENGTKEEIDKDQFFLGWRDLEKKKEVATVETKFQKVEIFDSLDPRFRSLESYTKSISNEKSYESDHPEFFEPERLVFLDGVMQSRSLGESAYHEALVHPAMFTHENPKRVAIIGGGEGATLREVLKHKSVQNIVMIEIDEEMVNTSRKYLPTWSDCSDIVGVADSCFDDPRVEVHYEDAVAWFIERFSDKKNINKKERFDLIIMDALDPTSQEFSDVLYGNSKLVETFHNSLKPEGIFISQIGIGDDLNDPPVSLSKGKTLETFTNNLKIAGFQFVREYSESHCGYMHPWKFMVAFEDFETKVAWYANQALIDTHILFRLKETVSGKAPLRFFDGATMQGYQYPSRMEEEVFCRNVPTPFMCERGHGFDPETPNIPITSFEVKQSTIPNAGRGVFFKESVPKGTYIAIDEGVNDIVFPPTTCGFISNFLNAPEFSSKWKFFHYYMYGYGFSSDYWGGTSIALDPGILTFINHGCGNTNNMGSKYSFDESTVALDKVPDEIGGEHTVDSTVYNPFVDRNHLMLMWSDDHTLNDINAGDELLDNYLDYISEENWKNAVLDYRAQCQERAAGAVTSYEDEL